jgi:hypothetical protein
MLVWSKINLDPGLLRQTADDEDEDWSRKFQLQGLASTFGPS